MFKANKPFKVFIALVLVALLPINTNAFAGQRNASEKSVIAKSIIEVQRKDYVEKYALKGLEWQFLISDALTIDEPKGILKEYLVTSGQDVKKGDPLISYTIPGYSIDIDEKKLVLKQSEKDYNMSLLQREEEISKCIQAMSAMASTSIDTKLLKLKIQKLEIAKEQYQYQTVKILKEQAETIKELEDARKLQYICAPYDGQIYIRDEKKPGTVLDPAMQLIYIRDTKSAVLSAEVSSNDKQWYNMKVAIEGVSRIKANADSSYEGTIITADSLFNGKVSTGRIYILPEKSEELLSVQAANITASSVTVKDVLVIPVKCVKSNKDLQYVYTIEGDGLIRKQYITGRNNGTDMWVYNGLSEGQKIIAE